MRPAALTVCVFIAVVGMACRADLPPKPAIPQKPDVPRVVDLGTKYVDATAPTAPAPAPANDSGPTPAPDPAPASVPPPGPATVARNVDPAQAVQTWEALRVLATQEQIEAIRPFLPAGQERILAKFKIPEVKELFLGEITGKDSNGGRVALRLKGNPQLVVAVMCLTPASGFTFDLQASLAWKEPDAGPKVTENRPVSLDRVLAGIEGKGRLYAILRTALGTLRCELFADKAPNTVANFVGIGRGIRAFRDMKTMKWVHRNYYDGLTFHRVYPRTLIQGGSQTEAGDGDPGYTLPDEFDLTLRHDRPGRLAMAGTGPNTGGAQFYITAMPAPWLDDHNTVFGQCEPLSVILDISRVPAKDAKPVEPVVIESVTFAREE